MCSSSRKRVWWGLAVAVPVCLAVACAVGFTPGVGLSVAGAIGGVTTTITFGPAGIVVTRSNETVKQAAALRLFDQDPVDRPQTAQMTLLSSGVKVTPLDVAKTLMPLDGEPINGSATVRFSIAAGQSSDLCDQAVFLSEYELDVQDNVVSIPGETADVSQEALDVMIANDITFCMDVTADFDAKLVMDEFDLEFGESELTASPTPSPTPLPNDNLNDNLNDNGSEPDTSVGAEAMAGCWRVDYSGAYSPDPAYVPPADGTTIYEYDATGHIIGLWGVIEEDGKETQIMELFRIGRPNAGMLANAVISSSQSTSFTAFGTQLNTSWTVVSHPATSCEVMTEITADTTYTITATPSGLPISGFAGTIVSTSVGHDSTTGAEATREFSADVVGKRTECPDPSLENVDSQEESLADITCDENEG